MLPKFSWDMDGSNMTEGPFLLKVEYPEDGYTDVAILFPAYDKSDRSILSGEMMKENASVAVNGNPNDKTFDVSTTLGRMIIKILPVLNCKSIAISWTSPKL